MRKGGIVLVVLGLLTAFCSSASAATDTVTNTNDSGPGSMRAVIAGATAGDTVDASGVTGTITLTSGAITINKNLVVKGPGAGSLAISGNGQTGIFTLTSGNVSFSGLTFTKGADTFGGGAIALSSGSLSVSKSAFSSNTTAFQGGAIGVSSSSAQARISDSTFSGNGAESPTGGSTAGGAISTPGPLTVANSTFADNAAIGGGASSGVGGAIAASGTLSVTASTFTGNSADGGNAAGGAIATDVSSSQITNSTFTGNSAGASGFGFGGAIDTGSTSTLTGDTIDGNSVSNRLFSDGSGIAGGTVIARDTIVSGNTGAPNCNAPVASSNHSLEGPSGSSCGFDLPSADPMLGPLAGNGGPTQTQALTAGSPAIDVVPQASCFTTTDQRGLARPDGGESSCDVGAYETQGAVATSLVAAPQLVLFPPPGGVGLGTVSATLIAAGSPVSGQTVSFSVAGTPLCSAMTNAGGTASCTVSLLGELAVLLTDSYTAAFAGSPGYLSSSSTVPALELGNGLAFLASRAHHAARVSGTLSYRGKVYVVLTGHVRHGKTVFSLRLRHRLRVGRYVLTVHLARGRDLHRTVTLR